MKWSQFCFLLANYSMRTPIVSQWYSEVRRRVFFWFILYNGACIIVFLRDFLIRPVTFLTRLLLSFNTSLSILLKNWTRSRLLCLRPINSFFHARSVCRISFLSGTSKKLLCSFFTKCVITYFTPIPLCPQRWYIVVGCQFN